MNRRIPQKQNKEPEFRANVEVKEQTTSKVRPLFPFSAEREYVRLAREYMKIYKSVLIKYAPQILELYGESTKPDVRYDALNFSAFNSARFRLLSKMSKELAKRFSKFALNKRLQKIAKYANNTSITQWNKIVKQTLGVDISKDYYSGGKYKEMLNKWTADNVQLIESVPQTAIEGLDKTILDAYKSGMRVETLKQEIMDTYNMTERRAELWARDQLGKLNYEITRQQHEDVGVTRYKWSSSRDERVRDCHRAFNGNIYSYDAPPEDWYMTKSRGKVFTGNRWNPSEGINCRCSAIPVFDDGFVDIPVSKTANQPYQTV